MRKIIILLVIAIVLAVSFSACKTKEKCPAYGHSGSIK